MGIHTRVVLGGLFLLLVTAACGSESAQTSATGPDSGAVGASGPCEDACTEGARSCEGTGVATCTRTATGCTAWSPATACGAGEICSGGTCTGSSANECTEGATQCSSSANGVVKCVRTPSGYTAWDAPSACPSPKVCSGGQCVAQCTNQCTVGSKQCSGLSNSVATCVLKPSGCTDWDTPVACDGGKTCSGGKCVAQCANQCTLGSKQCAGVSNGVATCVLKPSGCTDWDTTVACTNATTCSGGECVAQCANQCTAGAKKCAAGGTGVATCVIKPSGCTDWDVAAACAAGQTCAGAVCQGGGPVSWKVVTSGTAQNLRGVWGSAANDIWAVGDGGTLLHYDGNGWSPFNAGTSGVIAAVWGSGPNDVWAVSENAILHFNGATWTKSKPWAAAYDFNDISGTGPNDIWIAGAGVPSGTTYHSLVAHFDGNSWSLVNGNGRLPVATSWLDSVRAVTPNDVWAIDALGRSARYDGQEWKLGPEVAGPAISSTASNDVWVGGADFGIGHHDGATFEPFASPAAGSGHWIGAFARTTSDAWFVGTGGKIARFNGAGWALTAADLTKANLNGVWANGPSDVWGVGNSGTIVRYGP